MKTQKFWKSIFSKIVSDADVLFEVLDARNPLGTRNYMLEDFVSKNAPHKEIFLIINKIDLIPERVLKNWVEYFKLKTDFRIFCVSALYNRGIIRFKRQLNRIFSKRHIKAMIVGYPNTGKSSLIIALSGGKKKVGTSSKAGFTRGVMEIKIGERLSLIDTPGVIPLSEENEVDQALKAIINPEKIENLEEVVYKIIDIYVSPKIILEYFEISEDFVEQKLNLESAKLFIKKFYHTEVESHDLNKPAKLVIKTISKTSIDDVYQIEHEDFENIIELIGQKRGILAKGGEINTNQVYKTIIHAWQKNKIKYYTIPPDISTFKFNQMINTADR